MPNVWQVHGIWYSPPPYTVLVSFTVWARTQRASCRDLSASSRICWVAPRKTMVQASPRKHTCKRIKKRNLDTKMGYHKAFTMVLLSLESSSVLLHSGNKRKHDDISKTEWNYVHSAIALVPQHLARKLIFPQNSLKIRALAFTRTSSLSMTHCYFSCQLNFQRQKPWFPPLKTLVPTYMFI